MKKAPPSTALQSQSRSTQQREAILEAVSFAAEQFLRSPNWEQPIDQVLAQLGQAVNVSRVYIFENFVQEDGADASCIRYEWAAPGITPQIDFPMLQAIPHVTPGIDRWVAEMKADRLIYGYVQEMSPEERLILEPQSIVSIVVVPIYAGAEWWGFIGFDDCVSRREWAQAEMESLRAAANILGAAIQRAKAEKALRHSEIMNRTLLQSLPDILLRISADGRIMDIYGVEAVVAELRQQQALDLSIAEILPLLPPDYQETARKLIDFIEQVQASGEATLFEYTLPQEGIRAYYEARLVPTDDGEALVIIRDVTERKRSEMLLQEAQKMESVGVLAGGVAHDFNNLLTGLMAQASLVQKKLPADSPLQSHLDKIVNITWRATDLTHQLLTYAGKTEAQVETLDLNALVEQNVGLLETMLPLQSLFTELQPGPIMVKADRGQLQQLIMNLIINAAEAIKVKNGRVDIKTSLVCLDASHRHHFTGGHTLPAGEYVCLAVIDNGIGMDQATLSRIFDPFFTTKPHGHGLGLSATLGIVRSQNGALQVESQPDQGTRFLVWLPVDVAAQPDGEENAAPDRHDIPGLILLVDDEAPVREAVVDILQTMGISAIMAEDGQEGMVLFEQHRDEITAVLLDMQMPVMDGEAMLKAIRHVDQTKPVILSSGYSERELSGLLQQEATFFLQKPYDMSQLLNMITAVAGS